jgi:hypothetical protein
LRLSRDSCGPALLTVYRYRMPITAVSLRVSEKGGLSVYGLGRFPVTLYPEQWESLLGMSEQIQVFIAENRGKLKWKES